MNFRKQHIFFGILFLMILVLIIPQANAETIAWVHASTNVFPDRNCEQIWGVHPHWRYNGVEGVCAYRCDIASCNVWAGDPAANPIQISVWFDYYCAAGCDYQYEGGLCCGDALVIPYAATEYATYRCSDGIDNDGDGKSDYPADPGCTSATDDTESNFMSDCHPAEDNTIYAGCAYRAGLYDCFSESLVGTYNNCSYSCEYTPDTTDVCGVCSKPGYRYCSSAADNRYCINTTANTLNCGQCDNWCGTDLYTNPAYIDNTGKPYCVNGVCVQCTNTAQCDDSNICTQDACTAGVCTHTNNANLCRAVNGACDVAEYCSGGSCPADTFGVARKGTCSTCQGCTGSSRDCTFIPSNLDTWNDCKGTCDECNGGGACRADSTFCTGNCGVCTAYTATNYSCTANNLLCSDNVNSCGCIKISPTSFNCENCTLTNGVGATCEDYICNARQDSCNVDADCPYGTSGCGYCFANASRGGFKDCFYKLAGTQCLAATGCFNAAVCTGTSFACPAPIMMDAGSECGDGLCNQCNDLGVCVDMTNVQDSTGKSVCDRICQKCLSGACVNQGSGEDLFNQCSTGVVGSSTSCKSNTCSGLGTYCGYLPSSTICRPVAGTCDVAEYCTGASYTCSADIYRTGDWCGVCQYCTGSSSYCTAISLGQDPYNDCTASYTSCGAIGLAGGCTRSGPDGNCNGEGLCNAGGLFQNVALNYLCNVATPNVLASPSCSIYCTESTPYCVGSVITVKRYSCGGGGTCSLSSAYGTCQIDNCAESGDLCSEGHCVGCATNTDCGTCQVCTAGVCVNAVSGTDIKNECPGAFGACAATTCDGTGKCGYLSSSNICRSAVDACDVSEYCTGTSYICPSDAVKPAGLAGGNPGGICRQCDGIHYSPVVQSSAQDLWNQCTTGVYGTAISCQKDNCSGSGAFCGYKTSADVCRPAITSPLPNCDIAEYCSGASYACPADAYGTGTAYCNFCETCTGTSAYCSYVTNGTVSSDCIFSGWNGCSGKCIKTMSNSGRCNGAGLCATNTSNIVAYKVCNLGTEVDATSSYLACDGNINYNAIANSCAYGTRYSECNGFGSCDGGAVVYYGSSVSNAYVNTVTVASTNGSTIPTTPVSSTKYCGTATSCTEGSCIGTTYYRGCTGTGTCKTDNSGAVLLNNIFANTAFTLTSSCGLSGTTICDYSIYNQCIGNTPALDPYRCDASHLCLSDVGSIPGTPCSSPTPYCLNGVCVRCTTATQATDCNDSNPCTVDVCTAGVCSNPIGNAGVVCRATNGVCDVAETCNGITNSCPADAYGTGICRASAGACDVAEYCTGSSWYCPFDVKNSSSTVCRASAGVCDPLETCSGFSSSCPANVLYNSTTIDYGCGTCQYCSGLSVSCSNVPSGSDYFVDCLGNCDSCNGVGSCSGSSAVCVGNCDVCFGSGVNYNCVGVNASCTGNCDVCSGSGTAFNCAASSALCTGNCDVCNLVTATQFNCAASNALCLGTDASCSCNTGGGTSFSCSVCTTPSFCSGVGGSCVGCVNNAQCDDSNPCTVDTCNAGSCSNVPGNAGTVCRAASGECDIQETCTGSSPTCPSDVYRPLGTDCTGFCSSCNGAGTCISTLNGFDYQNECNPSFTLCLGSCQRTGTGDNCNGFGVCGTQTSNIISGSVCTGAGVQTAANCGTFCSATSTFCIGASLDQNTYGCNGAGSCTTVVGNNCVVDPIGCAQCTVNGNCTAIPSPTCANTTVRTTYSGLCSSYNCTYPGTNTACSSPTPYCSAGSCVQCLNAAQCDDGNLCTVDSCNAGSCSNVAGNAGTVCRASAGTCDPQETCTGSSTSCPANVLYNSTTIDYGCGTCQYCSGLSVSCSNVPSGSDYFVDCIGNCDSCNGVGSCAPSNAVCTGNCDTCSGSGVNYNCAAVNASCTGNCDVCSGSGTAFNCAANNGLCTGNCDVCNLVTATQFNCAASNALCSGTDASCSCTIGGGTSFNCSVCTTPQFCSGVGGSCVGCVNNAQCDDSNPCTVDTCNTGSCSYVPGNAGTVCRAASGECDIQETCTGSSPTCPSDVYRPLGTDCTGFCSSCNGAGSCIATLNGFDYQNECSGGFNTCITGCTRAGPDGFCSGLGTCNANGNTSNIIAGNVCIGAGVQTPLTCTNFCSASSTFCSSTDLVRNVFSCNGGGSCSGTSQQCLVTAFGCAQCTANSNCTAIPPNDCLNTTIRRTYSGLCLSNNCTYPATNFACSSPTAYCNAGSCVNCLNSGQCTAIPASFCASPTVRTDYSGLCSGFSCTYPGVNTTCSGATPYCNAGTCVNCVNSEQCTAVPAPICASPTIRTTYSGLCSGFSCSYPGVNTTCSGATPFCSGGSCVACLSNNDCNDGLTCTQDICNAGVCSNPAGNAGTVCRAVNGLCDVAETCTGLSTSCPSDTFRPYGYSGCNFCEVCSGINANCVNVTSGQDPLNECIGNCDSCNGVGSCAPSNAVCTGNCDTCLGSGNNYNCAAVNASCTGNCDVCSGSGTAFNCAANNGLCTGNCDVCNLVTATQFNCAASNALCSGTDASCSCTIGGGTSFNCSVCTTPQYCSGVGGSCIGCSSDPQCDDGNPCTVDTCSAGSCSYVVGNAGVVCGLAVGECQTNATCTGSSPTCPAVGYKALGTDCSGFCTSCNAVGVCTSTGSGFDWQNECLASFTNCVGSCQRTGPGDNCNGFGVCGTQTSNIISGSVCTGAGVQTAANCGTFCSATPTFCIGASLDQNTYGCNGAGSCTTVVGNNCVVDPVGCAQCTVNGNCTAIPPNDCLNTTVRSTYSGLCLTNNCTYPRNNITCISPTPFCNAGSCVTCLVNSSCTTIPAPTCANTTVRTTYSGFCSGFNCLYPGTNATCTAPNPYCSGGNCVQCLNNGQCTTVPNATCLNSSVRTVYSGVCNGANTCTYPGVNIACGVGQSCSIQNGSGVCSTSCGNGILEPLLGEECDDNNVINGDGCDNMCRETACTIGCGVNINPYTGCSGLVCSMNDLLQVGFSVIGTTCDRPETIQIDYYTADGKCAIQRSGFNMSGINSLFSAARNILVCPMNDLFNFTYLIPSIPDACAGKNLTNITVGLYSNSYTVLRSNTYYVGTAGNIILDQCSQVGTVASYRNSSIQAITTAGCIANTCYAYDAIPVQITTAPYGVNIWNGTAYRNYQCGVSDNVCPDDFTYNGLCGNNGVCTNHSIPDNDCVPQTDMKCGSTFNPLSGGFIPTCNVVLVPPGVPPHYGCGAPSSCVYASEIDGSNPQCYAVGAVRTNLLGYNIQCMINQNMWCPQGYMYNALSSRCEYLSAQCNNIGCPQAALINWTLFNNPNVNNETLLYMNNYYLTQYLNNSNCFTTNPTTGRRNEYCTIVPSWPIQIYGMKNVTIVYSSNGTQK